MARTRYRGADYCALCGAQLHNGSLNRVSDWRQKVRAVQFSVTRPHPFVTGVGYMQRRRVVADADASVPHTDPAASLEHTPLGSEYGLGEPNPLAFGLHDACWALLLSRTIPDQNPGPNQTAAVAATLFHVLYCLPKDRNRVLSPFRDYGGAWPVHIFRNYMLTYIEAPVEDLGSLILANPLPTPVGHAPVVTWLAQEPAIRGPCHPGDIFKRLPSEVIAIALAELPSTDLCSLRLASRAVACVSSPSSLPSSFWRSRFAPGLEMSFYMAGNLPELSSRDWRVLYGQIRHCLTQQSTNLGLCNRHRIWHVLGDLSTTLEALILGGLPAKHTCISHGLLLPHRPGIAAGIRRAPSQEDPCPSASFNFAWDAERAFYPTSTNIANPVRIAASFIHFDGQPIICGMRATASSSTVVVSQVGLIRPSTEQRFYLEEGREITKVRVVCSNSGVVGAQFLVNPVGSKNFERGTWHSLGTTNTSQPRFGTAELTTSGRILGLTLDFDACKCISIGLLEPSEEESEMVSTTLVPLWSPDIPRDFQLSKQVLDQVTGGQESKCFLNMDFGGHQGELLALLNRITPFVNSRGLLQGMAFFYDDGTELVFGCRRVFYKSTTSTMICPEPSITIRGSAGERIICVKCEVDTDGQSQRLRVQIKTNMGYKATIANRLQSQSFSTGVLLLGFPGHIITGFIAQMTDFNGTVETLDARYIVGASQVSPPKDAHYVAISQYHLDVAAYLSDSDADAHMSGVEFSQIRSIRFSSGGNGRSRTRDNVCGMLIKFWDMDHPLILGQWIQEVNDTCIELEQGEKIIEFNIWYTQVKLGARGFTTRPSLNLGKVAGLRLMTSKGQKREVRFVHRETLLHVQHRENTLETITGLIWTLNHQAEYIQVLRTPSLAHVGTKLVPLGFTPIQRQRFSRFDHHNKRDLHDAGRLFWQEPDPETGAACQLIAVDAFFYHRSHRAGRTGHVGLVGLRFRYARGVMREVGCCTASLTTTMESVELANEEMIFFERRRDEYRRGEHYQDDEADWDFQDDEDEDHDEEEWELDERNMWNGMALAFYFASGRTATLPIESRSMTGPREFFMLDTEPKLLEKQSALMNAAEWKLHQPPPRSRGCVGLWVQMRTSPRTADWVHNLGPVFHCDE